MRRNLTGIEAAFQDQPDREVLMQRADMKLRLRALDGHKLLQRARQLKKSGKLSVTHNVAIAA